MADITFYDAYVPIFLKCLDAADAILDKAVQHAKDNALNVDAEYINAAIADDMFPFAKQIQTCGCSLPIQYLRNKLLTLTSDTGD